MTTRRRSRRYGRRIKLTAYQWAWVGMAVAAALIVVLTQIAQSSRVLIAIVSFVLGVSATVLISLGDTERRGRKTARPARREPSLINPPRPKDRNKWPILQTEQISELREPRPAARRDAEVWDELDAKIEPPRKRQQPKRNIMAELLDEDEGEPENGFHEVKWAPVSAEDHRAQLHQRLLDEKGGTR